MSTSFDILRSRSRRMQTAECCVSTAETGALRLRSVACLQQRQARCDCGVLRVYSRDRRVATAECCVSTAETGALRLRSVACLQQRQACCDRRVGRTQVLSDERRTLCRSVSSRCFTEQNHSDDNGHIAATDFAQFTRLFHSYTDRRSRTSLSHISN